jgi:hypothetical protein
MPATFVVTTPAHPAGHRFPMLGLVETLTPPVIASSG